MRTPERQPMPPLLVSLRALRALELATYGSYQYAARQVRDELLDLERVDLLRVAATMAVESELRLTQPSQVAVRRRAIQATLLEVTWRLP